MRTVETRVGFVCFGEVNTPIDRLQKKHDAALSGLKTLGVTIIDAGLVVDDPKYATAKTALAKLRKEDMDLPDSLRCRLGADSCGLSM